jgi:hypothetical protein
MLNTDCFSFLITIFGVCMKRFSLPIFSSSAPSAITLAIGVGLSAMTLAVQAQEKVLRIAMTAADIPRTLGQPDQCMTP